MDGSLLAGERDAIERWQQHFYEHWNGTVNHSNEVNDQVRNDLTPYLREAQDAIHEMNEFPWNIKNLRN